MLQLMLPESYKGSPILIRFKDWTKCSLFLMNESGLLVRGFNICCLSYIIGTLENVQNNNQA
jgi:hypothetical protein